MRLSVILLFFVYQLNVSYLVLCKKSTFNGTILTYTNNEFLYALHFKSTLIIQNKDEFYFLILNDIFISPITISLCYYFLHFTHIIAPICLISSPSLEILRFKYSPELKSILVFVWLNFREDKLK